MMNPRPSDVLENLIATLDEKVLPRLQEADVLSAVTTTRHMLRYVLNQLRCEPASFAAELPKLVALLNDAKLFFAQAGETAELARIETALTAAEGHAMVDHETLAVVIQQLREGLHGALGDLIKRREVWSDRPGYSTLRETIRDYLSWQNSEEAQIVGPAFYGQGARR